MPNVLVFHVISIGNVEIGVNVQQENKQEHALIQILIVICLIKQKQNLVKFVLKTGNVVGQFVLKKMNFLTHIIVLIQIIVEQKQINLIKLLVKKD